MRRLAIVICGRDELAAELARRPMGATRGQMNISSEAPMGNGKRWALGARMNTPPPCDEDVLGDVTVTSNFIRVRIMTRKRARMASSSPLPPRRRFATVCRRGERTEKQVGIAGLKPEPDSHGAR